MPIRTAGTKSDLSFGVLKSGRVPKMLGRREFAAAGISTAALALAARKAPAQAVEHGGHAADACAKACSDCQRACDACSTHCAHQLHAGKTEHLKSLATCQDCADLCAASSQIVSRGGPFS